MKIFKYILFIVLIVFIGTAIFIAVQPNEFEVKRTRIIQAPASMLYNNVIDFKNWESWSPWVEKNPDMQVTLGKQTKGIGASQSWIDEDGIGRMKILATTVNSAIDYELQFDDFDPSKVSWSFEPTTDGKTKVTWKMNNDKVPFMFKGFAAFSGGFDAMIGPDFERGLEKLDSIIVNNMTKYHIKVDGITEYGGGFYMYKTTSATGTNISQIMDKQYGTIMAYMTKNSIVANGMPFTIYNEINAENGNIIMSNAIPVLNKVSVNSDSEVLCSYIPKTKVLKTTLKGNYNNLPEAWKAAMVYLAQNNLVESNLKPFEIYTNDPDNIPNPANWITKIYIPIEE